MIKCLCDGCTRGKGDLCCCECDDADCKDRCRHDPAECGDSQNTETNGLTLFQSNAMAIMQKIADLDLQMKQLEAQDKAVRQELQEAMDKYGIKKFENDILKITYVEPTTRSTIDSKKLKEDLPAIAEKYTKISQVKGSVKIEVK